MDIRKSIDFLLENAGDVIKYRLHKEILKDISETEEENLLEKVLQTPYYKLVESYAKPNGYIGIGMHSADRFMETRLQDGETAARLLSYYAIPKTNPLIKNFVAAMRDDEILKGEFEFYPTAFEQYNTRYSGLKNGTSIMVLIYAMQAMLGYGDDDYVIPFQNTSLKAFKAITNVYSVADFALYNEKLIKRFKTPYYVTQHIYVPCVYHLATLAYTNAWRTNENIEMMAKAINHINNNQFMDVCNGLVTKYNTGKYGGSLWMLLYPFSPYKHNTNYIGVMYRRVLTEIAMLGVGTKVDIIRQSVTNLNEELSGDGIIKWTFDSAYQKQQFRAQKWPTAYCDVWLEADHKKGRALECDLTFWAVQLLHILGQAEF